MKIVHRLGCCFVPAHLYCEPSEVIPLEPRHGNTKNVVFVLGRLVYLTPNEYPILYVLMSQCAGEWVGRERLLDAIGDTGQMDDRSIDVIIKRLRRKLFPVNRHVGHLFIETGYGLGYRIPSRLPVH